MQRLAALVLLVGGLCGTSMCQYSAEFSSYRGDMRYDFRITPEQLANTPAWLEDQPNPPLSPRRAREIAVVSLETLFADGAQWRRSAIALVPVNDRWVYTIEFTEPLKGECTDCLSTPFIVVVLMDGTAVSATVSPWPVQHPLRNGR
jgi:hypothetical protein